MLTFHAQSQRGPSGPDLPALALAAERLVDAVVANPALSPPDATCLSDDLRDLQRSYAEMDTAAIGEPLHPAKVGTVILSRSWIFDTDARLFLQLASALIGYAFDESDWQAVATQLERTPQTTAEYPLVGRITLTVALERLDDGGHTEITVAGSPSHTIRTQLETLFGVLTREGQTDH